MKKLCTLVLLCGLVLQSASGAVDLKQSKFSQVVNDVEIISSNTRHAAQVNDVFKMPDVLRTGTGARAEMIADDGTITRVGANTIFSFDPTERTIDLQQGSLLFHSPHGKGGGTIRTGSATASVLGTTIIVTTTPNGGFKVLCLEGVAEVRFLNGLHETLEPGQLAFVLPGGQASPIIVFRLDVETQGSLLVTGFNDPLPSWPQIEAEITRQLTLLLNGYADDTDLSVGDNATPQSVQIVMNIIDGGQPTTSDAAIIGSDHTPNQTIPENYSPLDPQHTQTGSFTPPGNFSEGLAFLGLTTPASGFTGNNIDIDTKSIDLSMFSGDSDFDIMASGNLRIWQSVDFNDGEVAAAAEDSVGLPSTVALFAGGAMEIAPDATLEADTGTFGLVAGSFATLNTSDGSIIANNTLEGVSVLNYDGDVDILSQSDLTWENDGYYDGYVYAGNDVTIQSDAALTLGQGESVTTLGGGYEYDFEAEAGGSITLSAVDDLTMNFADVDAGGDVSITSGGTLGSLTYGGDIYINDTEIYAGDNGSTGGNLNITSYDGNVTLSDDYEVYAYSGDTSDTGNVNVYAYGNVGVKGAYIYADQNVDISADGSLSATADGTDTYGSGAIDIEDAYEIYAGYENDVSGSVSITAPNGGINLYDDDIYAYNDDSSSYDGKICIRAGDNIIINDTDLYADGNVNITSGGTISESADLTTSGSGAAIDIEDTDIYAGYDDSTSYSGGSVNIEAQNGDVYVNDADIYAYYGNDSDGDINIYATGNITVQDADFYASGSVNITSGESAFGLNLSSPSGYGDVYIDDADIYAGYDTDYGGSANIYADGNVTIYDADIYAYDSVNIIGGGALVEAGEIIPPAGTVDIEDADLYGGYDAYYDETSYDGGDVNITAYNGNVIIADDSEIYAYLGNNSDTGNVNVYAAGTGDIEYTYIDAGNNVNIETGDSLTLGGYESDEIDAGGSISLLSDTSDVYVDYDLYAYGDVDITSGSSVGTGGNIDIEDAEIYAGDDEYVDKTEIASGPGGNVNINAYNGNVTINGSDIYAYVDSGTDTGNVNVYAYGTGDVEDSSIYADGDVNIESVGSLTVGYNESDDIEAGGSISLLSDTSDVYVDYDLDADLDVDITSGSSVGTGGNIDIEDAEIYAGDGGTAGGNVNINAYNGNVTMNYDYEVYAYSGDTSDTGNVNVYAYGNVGAEESYIYANGNVDISADGSLSATADVSLTSEETETSGSGAIDIEDSYIYAGYDDDIPGGSVSITAPNGGINLYDDEIYAYSENSSAGIGTITISAGDNIIINDSDLYAGGNVNITSGGTILESADLTSSGSGAAIDIEDTDIYAGYGDSTSYSGGSVTIEAQNGDVYVNDSDIYAYYGNDSDGEVSIYATGNITAQGGDVYASGNVNITSGDSVFNLGLSPSSGYGDIYINDADIYAGYDTDYGGSANINAGGNATIYDADIYAYDNVNITAGGAIVQGGEVSTPAGSIDIEDADLYAGYDAYDGENSYDGGNVNITAYNGNVIIADDSEIYAYLGNNSDTGNVSVYAAGTGDVEETYIDADNNVTIETGDSLTLGGYESDEIDAGGSISLLSDTSDVYVDYDLYADGDVDITSGSTVGTGGNIDIEDSEIYAGDDEYVDKTEIASGPGGNVNINAYNGNVTINGSDIYAYVDSGTDTGNVNVYAYGTGDVEDSYIYADGNVNIESVDSLTLGYYSSYEIDAGGSISLLSDTSDVYVDYDLDADLDVDITSGSSVGTGGNIDIENAEIYAGDGGTAGGNVNINAYNGNVTLNYDYEVYAYTGDTSDTGNVNVYAYGNVGAEESYIYANGNVDITSGSTVGTGGDIDIEDSEIEAGDGGTIGGNVNINAYNGNVYMYDNEIYAYVEGGTGTGNVNVYAYGTGDVEDSYISADGNVNIESVGSLTVGYNEYDDIEASGSISLLSDTSDVYVDYDLDADLDVDITSGNSIAPGAVVQTGGNIDIEDAEIYAGDGGTAGGNININAYNGNVTLNDDYEVYAYSGDTADTGNVSVYASGNVDVESSDIYADGSVYLTANGPLYVLTEAGSGYGDVYLDDAYIEAGYDSDITGAVYINAGGNVSIEDSSGLYANGDVDITAGGAFYSTGESAPPPGSIDIENSYIEAGYDSSTGGNINIQAYNGDVYMNNDRLDAYAEDTLTGNINVDADGNIDVLYSSLDADNEVTLASNNGYVNVVDSYQSADLSMDYWYISAGTYIDLTADGDLTLEDSYVQAYGGDVNITAGGSISISGGSYNQIYGNNVTATANGGIDIVGEGITANNGDVTITAGDSGDQNEYTPASESEYSPDYVGFTSASINISLTGIIGYPNVGFLNDTEPTALIDYDNRSLVKYDDYITIDGGLGVMITDTPLDAISGDVDLTADTGDVEIEGGSLVVAEDGNINVTATTGNVTVSGSDLYAESGGGVDIAAEAVSIINSTLVGLGDVDLTAATGDVDIEDDSTIVAQDGGVNITATTGAVTIDNSYLEADNNYNVIGDNGDVDITAAGDVTISDSTINAQDDVNINSTGGILSINEGRSSFSSDFNTGVDIYSYNTMTLSGQSVSIQDAALYGFNNVNDEDGININSYDGNVELQDVEMAAWNGNINVYAMSGTLTLDEGSADYGVVLQAYNYIYLGADDGVSISDADINAGNDIDITSGADLSVYDSYLEATGNVLITADGDISLTSDDSNYEIYADNGGITITSTDGEVDISDEDIEANGDVSISSGQSINETLISPSPGSLTVYQTGITSDYGNVDIYSGGDAYLYDSGISAGKNVSIETQGMLWIGEPVPLDLVKPSEVSFYTDVTAGGSISLTSDYSDVDIYYADLTAGDNMTIAAPQGEVDIEDTQMEVASDDSGDFADLSISGESDITASGNVYITANGGTINISGEDVYITDSTFEFGGAISITGSDITAQDGDVDITAEGGLSISATGTESFSGNDIEGGGMMICGSSISADSGNVNIENQFSVPDGFNSNGEDINIGGSAIIANADSSTGLIGGTVTISTLGNVSITDNSTIQGSDDVDISAGGLIDEGVVKPAEEDSDSGFGDVYLDGSSVLAGVGTVVGGNVNINAGGNISILDGSEIYAYNNVNINAGNAFRVSDIGAVEESVENVDIEDSYIAAGYEDTSEGGNVNIHAYGENVYLSDDLVTAASGTSADGDINAHAFSDIDVLSSGLDADGQVTLTADNGYVNVDNSYQSLDLSMSGWDISAGTYVDVTASDNLTISGSTITAYDGNVNLKSGPIRPTGIAPPVYDTLIEGSSSVEAYDTVNVTATEGDVEVYNSTLTADTGDVNVNATGNVDVENSTLSADYPTEIDYGSSYPNGTFLEAPSIDLSSTGGNIYIDAGGNVTLANDTINLGTDINITGSTLIADTGDVDMTTGLFMVNAGGMVDITGCSFTGGSVDISDGSTVTSTLGDVNLDAGQNITISGSTISAAKEGTDEDISASEDETSAISITAVGGDINLTAVNNIILIGSTFDIGGDINISADATIDAEGAGNDVVLNATGELTTTAGGSVDMSGCTVIGGHINIDDGSEIEAGQDVSMTANDVNIGGATVFADGNVDINANDTINLTSDSTSTCSITSEGTSAGAGVTVTAANTINVSDATIEANTASGTVTLTTTAPAGQVNVNGGSTIQTAYLNINSGDGILIDGTGGHLSGNTMSLSTSAGTAADDLSGDHTITVQNTDLSGFQAVNVSAHTVDLNGDNLSSSRTYHFDSFYGDYYINNGSVAGAVNFNHDTLDGTTAIVPNNGSTTTTQNPNNNANIQVGNGSGPAIYIGSSQH